MAGAIAKQWDVGATALGLTDKVVSLMKATTVDDVHPMAAYAAESLGGHLVLSPKLIGKAVDALQAKTSFRMQQIKLVVGLSSGGLAAQLCSSIPAIQVFMLITILRWHLDPPAVAAILYELLALTSVLKTMPVSAQQLEGLIESLDGYGATLLAAEDIPGKLAPFFDGIAEATSRVNYFAGLSSEWTPQILVQVFEAIRSEDVVRLDMRGNRGAVWLWALFHWLCPDDVGVYQDHRLLDGTHQGKICIHLEQSQLHDAAWTFQTWTSEENVPDIIVSNEEAIDHGRGPAGPSDGPQPPASISSQEYLFTPTDKAALGEITVALVRCIWKSLRLRGDQCGEVLFKDICREGFQDEIDHVPTLFGSPPLEDMGRVESFCRALVDRLSDASSKTLTQRDIVMDMPSSIRLVVEEVYGLDSPVTSGCREMAVRNANFIVLNGIVEDESGMRAFLRLGLPETEDFWCLNALHRGHGDMEEFCQRAYMTTEPGRRYSWPVRQAVWKPKTIALSARGQVVYPKILETFDKNQRQSLLLVVRPGYLIRDKIKFAQLDEQLFPVPMATMTRSHGFKPLDLFQEDGTTIIREPRMLDPRVIHMKAIMNGSSRTLTVQWKAFSQREPESDCIWGVIHNVQLRLACAHFAQPADGKLELSRRHQQLLDMRLRRLVVLDPLEGDRRPALSKETEEVREWAGDEEPGVRAIMPHTGEAAVDCLVIGGQYVGLPLVVQGQASLLECILQAEKKFGSEWLILSSP